MTGRKLTAALVALLILTAACGEDGPAAETPEKTPAGDDTVASNPEFGVSDGTISIGWLGDATGAAAFASGAQRDGAAAAVAWINSEGGVAGRDLELLEFDNQFTAERAVSGYESLVHDQHVLALVDTGPSLSTSALLANMETDGVPVFGPGQTIDAQLTVPSLYNFAPHYRHQAELMVLSMKDRLPAGEDLVVATIATDVPSAKDVIEGVEEATTDAGGTFAGTTLVSAESPNYANAVTAIADEIDSKGVNALAIHGSAGSGIGILTELVSRGLDDIVVSGIVGLASPQVFTDGPPEAAKLLQAAHGALPATADCEMCATIREFTEGTEWESGTSSAYFSIGWASVLLAQESIERAADAGALDWESMNAAATSKPFDNLGGLTCDLDFTKSNYSPCGTMFRWDGKSLTPVASFVDSAEVLTWTPPGA